MAKAGNAAVDDSLGSLAEKAPSSQRTRRTLKLCATSLAGVVALLASLNFGKYPVDAQLDHSWVAVTTCAAEQQWQFGRDIIFTMGPLGHLIYSTYSAKLFLPDFFAQIAIKSLYIVVMIVIALRLPLLRRVGFVAAALITAWLNYELLCLLLIVWTGGLLCIRVRISTAVLVALVTFVAVAALIKATLLFLAGITVALSLAAMLLRRDYRHAAVLGFGFVLAFLAAWLAAGQHWQNLPAYFLSAAEISEGYSAAMSLDPSPGILALGLLVLLGSLLQLALSFREERVRFAAIPSTALFIFSLFVAWKLGFARADGHCAWFFCYSLVATVAAPAFLSLPRVGRYLSLIVGCLSAWGLFNQLPSASRVIIDSVSRRPLSSIVALWDPAQAKRAAATLAETEKNSLVLSQTKQRLGNASVDVIGFEQGVALANNLNYRPAPIFQGYSAYTPFLAESNLHFYQSKRAPCYVLCKLQTIDNRLPSGDNSAVLLELMQHYHVALSENGYLLFQRSAEAPSATGRTLAGAGRTSIGESVTIPAGNISCELTFHETLLGRLVRFAYHSPPITLRLNLQNGASIEKRVVTALTPRGFIVSPCLLSNDDLERFVRGGEGTAVVESFTVAQPANSWLMQPTVSYRFSKLTIPTYGASE